ncbi:hypothetical protein [Hymenobacter siberiensis]|uniref:hypothetical protein n=2 Tax=Hymenobacter siberiensis TaxID=2848396 RepID=UPI001C1E61B4|nr:hypothetical protein [Hymenobacter siberiensis]
MKPLAKFIGAALVGAFALFTAPAAQAQVGVNINIGTPAWGPQVPYGTQYYYIPEIDGYYDLYNQQYIVFQDGYWVPLPQLYGYDPYQFHPVIVDYRGAQPWLRVDYYRQRYAYRPYRNYGPSPGYYNRGYGNSYGRPRYDTRGGYSNGRNYGDHDRDDRGGYRGNNNRGNDHDDRGGRWGNDNRGNDRDNRGHYSGGNNTPRSNPMPQQPTQQPQQGDGGYNPGQGGGNNGGGRGNDGGGRGNDGGGRGNDGNQGGGRGHGRD